MANKKPGTETNIFRQPVELLQKLITFDTTNPPGNEAECIKYIDKLLKQAGIKTTLLARDPNRPNLIARLKGQGSAPPLLLYGHVDVVGVQGQDWLHPPFEGKIEDGFLWGRGALDMKSGIAMMLCAFLRAAAKSIYLPGDVVLCIVSDEEALGKFGARYLVENHGEHFTGVRYALGEFGGFTFYIKGKKFYLVQVAEKQVCHIKAEIQGPPGHGAFVLRGGAMAKLGRALQMLDENYLPVHIIPIVRTMFETFAKELPFPKGFFMRRLLNHRFTDKILNKLGESGRAFAPLFHNMINATVVRGGSKFNVIPSQVEFEMDVRLLPGFSPEDIKKELRLLLGTGIAFDVLSYQPGSGKPDLGLFPTLAEILQEADPKGIPVPILITAATDARYFSKLGIQTYGFTPMQLPQDMNFLSLMHGANERIPVDSLGFGTEAILQALQRFHQ
ncbi:MAG: M20/M25/M40 family metallo-hydrolase [Candidatus Aminicenantes bacterium]|nr:M20/M25/M40 family metallo-hydrolase [Candidatus Aminicenantes bacterium]